MASSFDDNYKMRLITGPVPSEEEMEELFAEATALQMAMDEIVDDDAIELEELNAAYKEVVKKIRLNFYRAGKPQPMEG